MGDDSRPLWESATRISKLWLQPFGYNRRKSAADAGSNNGVDEALEGVSEAGR